MDISVLRFSVYEKQNSYTCNDVEEVMYGQLFVVREMTVSG